MPNTLLLSTILYCFIKKLWWNIIWNIIWPRKIYWIWRFLPYPKFLDAVILNKLDQTSESWAAKGVQSFSVWLCISVDCSMPGFPVLHHLPEFAQIHVHWISDAIQPSHPLPPLSLAFSLSQHQGLFQWVSSSHQVAKVLERHLQHQSFQWIFGVYFL